jgi:hypothetical protein
MLFTRSNDGDRGTPPGGMHSNSTCGAFHRRTATLWKELPLLALGAPNQVAFWADGRRASARATYIDKTDYLPSAGHHKLTEIENYLLTVHHQRTLGY